MSREADRMVEEMDINKHPLSKFTTNEHVAI